MKDSDLIDSIYIYDRRHLHSIVGLKDRAHRDSIVVERAIDTAVARMHKFTGEVKDPGGRVLRQYVDGTIFWRRAA